MSRHREREDVPAAVPSGISAERKGGAPPPLSYRKTVSISIIQVSLALTEAGGMAVASSSLASTTLRRP